MRAPNPSVLFASVAAAVLLIAAPAMADESQPNTTNIKPWNVTVSDTVRGGRPFSLQGFTLTKRLTNELDVIACKGDVCLDFWNAETGNPNLNETDIQAWIAWHLANGYTLTLKFGAYLVKGEDVGEVKATLSHALSSACDGSGAIETMGGGFVDTTVQFEISCHGALTKAYSWDVAPALNYSDWRCQQEKVPVIGAPKRRDQDLCGVGASLKAGVSRDLGNGLSIRAGFEAYTGEGGNDFVPGITLTKKF